MPYYTGTITNANPAQEYIVQLEAALATYNAIGTPDNNTWSKVETVTSIASFQYEVWKNSGSGVQLPNTFGTDFYVAFARGTAAGSATVFIKAFEGYLSGTDFCIRPVAGGNSNTQTVNSDYSWGDTTTGQAINVNSVATINIPSLVTTGFEYHFVINRDGMFLGAKVGVTDYAAYAGLFEPAFSYAPFTGVPLCLIARQNVSTYSNIGSTTAVAGTSRHPNMTTGSNTNSPFSHMLTDYGPISSSGTLPGDYQTVDKFTGKAEGRRMQITPRLQSPAVTGIVHGWMKNAMLLGAPSTARLGDTLTFDSKVYLHMGSWGGFSPSATQTPFFDTETV